MFQPHEGIVKRISYMCSQGLNNEVKASLVVKYPMPKGLNIGPPLLNPEDAALASMGPVAVPKEKHQVRFQEDL